MHILYFVVIPRKEAATPKEAIKEAEQFLGDNHFASAGEGLWEGGKCDWYEVGGRWSGLFTLLMLPPKKKEAYDKELERIEKEYRKRWDEAHERSQTEKGKKEKNEAAYRQIDEWREREILESWRKHFPNSKVLCPQARRGTFSFQRVINIAHDFGKRYDTDDALLMTKAVWRKFRKEWAKDWESLECVFTNTFGELPLSAVKETDALGRWWVVIDYHI